MDISRSAQLALPRFERRQLHLLVLAGLSVSLLVWFTYVPTLTLGFTGWDTVALLKAARDNLNHSFFNFFTLPLFPGMNFGYYRPFSSLSYGLDYLAWGLEPLGYHLTNVLIHWAVCLGLVVLGYQATRRLVVGWLAAILFAVQPLFGTMVANLAYRHDTLMTLGVVWCLVFTIAFLRSTGAPGIVLQVLAWGAYCLALGAKETGLIALPLVAALIGFERTRPARTWTRKFVLIMPFGLITLAYLLLHKLAVPANPLPSLPVDTTWFALAYNYLRLVLVPPSIGPLPAAALVILFLASIAGMLYLNRRNRALSGWLLLFLAWIGLATGMYIVTEANGILPRYAYIIAAPLVLLISIGLFSGVAEQPHPFALAGYGAKFIVLGILLLGLPGAPIFGLEPGWVRHEATANAYLAALDRLAADLPPGASLVLDNVPAKWLWFNSTQQWLDLKWADKKFRVVKQTAARKPRGHPVLTATAIRATQQIRLSAIYLSKED